MPKINHYINPDAGLEDWNKTFWAYQQTGPLGFGAMGATITYAGLARMFETNTLSFVQAGASNRIIANPQFFQLAAAAALLG